LVEGYLQTGDSTKRNEDTTQTGMHTRLSCKIDYLLRPNHRAGPPSETPRDLADFHSRHGEASRFASKHRFFGQLHQLSKNDIRAGRPWRRLAISKTLTDRPRSKIVR
jgi:hypothetical protein